MGRRFATIKDVAARAGVSTATVSRVINRDPKVSASTRKAVLEHMEELGYRVNPIARSLRSSTTRTIGIITPEFCNDFFMTLAEGIEEVLSEAGYTAFILNSRERLDLEQARVQLLIEKQADGAIVFPVGGKGEHFCALAANDIPFVMVDRVIDGLRCDAVLTDNMWGAGRAVEAAIQDGARTIGMIGGESTISSAHERYIGYRRALEQHGITPDESIILFGDMHFASGYRLMGELLGIRPSIRYVFVANIYMRLGAEKYLSDHHAGSGIRFISFDSSPLQSLFAHNYITVHQPYEQIGSTAATLLLQRIRRECTAPPRVHRLKPEIIFH